MIGMIFKLNTPLFQVLAEGSPLGILAVTSLSLNLNINLSIDLAHNLGSVANFQPFDL